MAYFHYNRKLKPLARKLRNNPTRAERKIWYELLANRQFGGLAFLRQRIIDQFIVDFFNKDLKLIVEIDGKSHDYEDIIENDEKREKKLKSLGYQIIRFSDWEVNHDMGGVAEKLTEFIENLDASILNKAD